VNILATAGTPSIPDLEALGVARVSLGSGPMRAALGLVREVARELKATGTYDTFTDDAMSFDEIMDLMKWLPSAFGSSRVSPSRSRSKGPPPRRAPCRDA